MSAADGRRRRSTIRSPIAAPEEVAAEPTPFPAQTVATPAETFFSDWRKRLMRNLSRRSTSRWEPLTWVHSGNGAGARSEVTSIVQPPRFHVHRGTRLWAAIEATITELAVTREISMNTAPDYVIAYLCNELAAKKLVAVAALDK